MKKIDLYIIRKFLGTFFYSIVLILMIVIVFDISERMEDFIDKKPSLGEIVFDYYFNFVPYFANLFSPLFVFIAVIYFTSRMAYRTEIIAILGSGVSFPRFLFPYMVGATVITALSLTLNHFVIPNANKVRLEFEEKFLRNPYENKDRNIHREIAPDEYVYFYSYNSIYNTGSQFAFEKITEGERHYYIKADFIKWDTVKQKWTLQNYFERRIDGLKESIRTGAELDTIFPFTTADFGKRDNRVEAMATPALSEFIEQERKKGAYRIPMYEVEKYRRTSFPFATFVLTLIGASIASRKVRGGIGWHIGLGLMIAFSYILFMQVSNTFATHGGLSASIAVWIPNILYAFLALFMLRIAPK